MKRNMNALSSAVLLLAFVLGTVSCGETAQQPTEKETGENAADTVVTETETEDPFVSDDLDPTLDFGGKTMNILGWTGEGITEFEAEQDGDIVNDAIYARNQRTEERMNVDLAYNLQPGDNANRAAWVKLVSDSVMAQDGAFDIVAGYSMSAATLAQSGMLLNLLDLPYLDFKKPWWPASLIDEAVCGDRLYFCSGDISDTMIYQQYCTYFNKKMFEQYDMESPYQLVRDGKWTLDKLMELSSGIYKDINGNGSKDIEDQYAFTTHAVYADTFYFSSGLRTTTRDAGGLPVIAEEFGGEKTQSLVTKLVDYLYRDDVLFLNVYGGTSYDDFRYPFINGNALFTLQIVYFGTNYLRNADFTYGVIPVPKYDEAQENYRQISGFPYTLYGIPVTAPAPETSAAVMECMASESYRTVSPALFETALKVKYASDSDASEMYDIIRGSVVFDIGRIFTDSLSAMTYSIFRENALMAAKTEWMSIYASKQNSLNSKFEKLIAELTAES